MVTSRKSGGDGDLLGQFGEEGPAFDIGGTLGAFDFGPMTVTGHGSTLNGKGGMCRGGETRGEAFVPDENKGVAAGAK